MKIKITERALLARVNRRLEKESRVIKICKTNSRWYNDFGRYYEVDTANNTITAQHIDLGGLAREMGCLAGYETYE